MLIKLSVSSCIYVKKQINLSFRRQIRIVMGVCAPNKSTRCSAGLFISLSVIMSPCCLLICWMHGSMWTGLSKKQVRWSIPWRLSSINTRREKNKMLCIWLIMWVHQWCKWLDFQERKKKADNYITDELVHSSLNPHLNHDLNESLSLFDRLHTVQLTPGVQWHADRHEIKHMVISHRYRLSKDEFLIPWHQRQSRDVSFQKKIKNHEPLNWL